MRIPPSLKRLIQGPNEKHQPPCVEGTDCPRCGECEHCGLAGNDNTAYWIKGLDRKVCEHCAKCFISGEVGYFAKRANE